MTTEEFRQAVILEFLKKGLEKDGTVLLSDIPPVVEFANQLVDEMERPVLCRHRVWIPCGATRGRCIKCGREGEAGEFETPPISDA